MADKWDEDNFEPEEFEGKRSGDQWEGEDEEDINGLKENWDDEEEEEKQDKTEDNEVSSDSKSIPVKKKKTVKQKILEKEEQKKEELLKKAKLKEEVENDDNEDDEEESIFSSKNNELAEKLQRQKLVEEADLEVAKETFGVDTSPDDATKSIDLFKPTNQEEFNELAKMIVEKLTPYETSIEYPGFLETLIRDLATGIEADEVKKLASVLNILATEKQKAQKVIKGKKKAKKAVLGGGAKGTKGVDLADYSTYGDEYDDFM